jgi:hypothetical protein
LSGVRDREIQHGADKNLAAADAVGEPTPRKGTDNGANTGAHQHDGRLAEGELPGPDQEGEHKADQEVIEEFQGIADDGCGEDLDLVGGQTCPLIENLEHGLAPLALVRFERALRLRADHAGRSYPVEIANGRVPRFENASGYRYPTRSRQKFAIPV